MEEIVEQAIDAGAMDLGRSGRKETVTVAVGVAVCFFGGAALGAYLSKRYFKKRYEDLASQEIAEAKAYYARLNKAEPYDTPGSTLEALGERGKAAAEAVLTYQGERADGEDESVTVTEERTEVVRQNIFTQNAVADGWDQEQEQSKRDAHPDEPYILSHDEYMENEPDYHQVTLTYFAEDDVLCDEKDQPIPAVEETVGEDNLSRFGHGSRDNRILYIQNDRIQMMFEVVKNDGSYAREVAGFIEHSDHPRIMKMRGERD